MIVGTDKGKEQSNSQIFSLIKTESVFKYATDPIILKEFLNVTDDALKDLIKFYIVCGIIKILFQLEFKRINQFKVLLFLLDKFLFFDDFNMSS